MENNEENAAQYIDIDELIPHPDNPRINDHAVEEVAGSIKRFGFAAPIIARREDNTVIAGHTRLKAAKKLGLSKVPVRFMDLDPVDAKLLMLADNKIGERADWNDDALQAIFEELQDEDLSGLGWDEEELSGILGDLYSEDEEEVIVEPPAPVQSDFNFTLLKGNCLEKLKEIPDNSIDSIVTDPPYHLMSVVQRYGKEGSAPAKHGSDGLYQRQSAGFMGQQWDGVGEDGKCIAFNVELWKECYRVLKHGGHMVAFSATRTVHPMGVAIADAGFEIRDMISWLYFSGFPKSHDVSKAIDSRDKTDKSRSRQLRFTEWMRSTGLKAKQIDQYTDTNMGSHYLSSKSQPAIPTRDLFEKMRPHIPIPIPNWVEEYVDFRSVESENMKKRKIVKTVKTNKLLSGIVSCGRGIGDSFDMNITAPATPEAKKWQGWGTALKPSYEPAILARKPLEKGLSVAENVLKHGTGAINIDACRFAYGDPCWVGPQHDHSDQWDNPTIGSLQAFHYAKDTTRDLNAKNDISGYKPERGRWPANIYQCPKASRSEREAGLEHLQGKSGAEAVDRNEGSAGLDNPRAGAGRTADQVKNFHPTVKPIGVMRWLCRLITPPNGTVLDPFLGSGTTAVAACLEGFDAIGCEMTEEYYPIIEGRIEWAKREREHGPKE